MSLLTVSDRGDGVLLVDSRLVAAELGIQHKNFLGTIEKYNSLMASNPDMGAVAFETREFQTKQGNVSYERWAWLTELQATFIMTLSRNTEQVVNCKLALAVAFEKAKQVIKDIIPAQSARIRELELELQVAQAQAAAAQSQERLMQATNAIVTMHGAGMLGLMQGKPEAIVQLPPIVLEKNILVNQAGKPLKTFEGLSKTKLAKRYGMSKPQDLVNWLQSMGKADLIQPGITTAPCQFVPSKYVPELDRLWAARQGERQFLLGE